MFKSKKEKFAFVRGLKAGARGKKPFGRKKKSKQNNNGFVKDILNDLQNKGITDLDSDKFVEWCRKNDFIPSNIRQEIAKSKYKPVVSNVKPKKIDYVEYNSYRDWEKHFIDAFFGEDGQMMGGEPEIFFDALRRQGDVSYVNGKLRIKKG